MLPYGGCFRGQMRWGCQCPAIYPLVGPLYAKYQLGSQFCARFPKNRYEIFDVHFYPLNFQAYFLTIVSVF